jgi:hypothetical protein
MQGFAGSEGLPGNDQTRFAFFKTFFLTHEPLILRFKGPKR